MPRHRILVIGSGSIGERHIRCFQATGRAEVSFCEVNDELRSTIADRYGVPAFVSTGATDGHNFDAAVICVPAHLHVPLALDMAGYGRHLLIEKPLSTSMDGVQELRQVIDEKHLRAAVAYVWRHHPGLRMMREILTEGSLGRPMQLIVNGGQHFPTHRPAYREIYYTDHATGGGAIQDALTHTLNVGEWLFGPIERLTCDAAHQVLEGVEVEDTAHVLARHGEVMASYSCNQFMAPNEGVYTVACERGTVRVEVHNGTCAWMDSPGGDWRIETFELPARDDPFMWQATHFMDFIEGKGGPACSLEEGIQTLQVNLAALDAAEKQVWVEL
ncbi:MAG: Gfo/Idh/MocA family oxidoreductase [Planctomycetota bacterium]|jgi:predicted dehydrogenase|nr:Gfo/Idh/MocA family oxidoreductase [Planctomycetota bacterium]MDP7253443.1 Gfo/Idh/MocA family oxidoreductase [Planctomycetota bacterium]